MSQKVFYRYNSATEQYERVFPSRGERVRVFLRQFAVGALGALAVVAIAYSFMDFPREKQLRRANDRLRTEVGVLNRRADQALKVMEDLAVRDNNFYRVMLQADPISAARRYGGLERQRNFERLDSLSDGQLLVQVTNKLDQLDRMVYTQIKSFDHLKELSAASKSRMAHIPAIPPISEKYLRAMASGYGYRSDPIYGTTRFHEGMDFSSPVGTPVYATGDGKVTEASWKSAYGNLVEIDHGFNYTTRYAHLSEIKVRPGQTIRRGDLIGKVGNTGKSTGPHLHYEVRFRGAPQNPVNYYFYDISPEQYDEMILQAENAGHMMD